ncbi:MAG: VanZ family protein [Clostridiales bacterium]|nr:VanZ family protein [Clostridiales bacterium]
MKRKIPYIIAALLATLMIFSNSLQTAEVSSASSGRIVTLVSGLLSKAGIEAENQMLVVIVRKSAHIAEFTLQGILIALCFAMPYKRRIIYILFLGLLTACADEYIQLFSPGRGSLVQDVFIDFAGTIIGTVIAGISCRLKKK